MRPPDRWAAPAKTGWESARSFSGVASAVACGSDVLSREGPGVRSFLGRAFPRRRDVVSSAIPERPGYASFHPEFRARLSSAPFGPD